MQKNIVRAKKQCESLLRRPLVLDRSVELLLKRVLKHLSFNSFPDAENRLLKN